MTRSWAMADQPDRIVTLSVNNTSQRSNTMSSPDSSSPIAASSPLESDERTCHILPCNIDFQGMAPTHIYFRPVGSPEGHYSSTFRGRGLTATKDGKTNAKMALLSLQNEQVQVKASIENVLEWHHEHDPETIQMDDLFISRVHVAQEWSEVGHALHDPIPLEGEKGSIRNN